MVRAFLQLVQQRDERTKGEFLKNGQQLPRGISRKEENKVIRRHQPKSAVPGELDRHSVVLNAARAASELCLFPE